MTSQWIEGGPEAQRAYLARPAQGSGPGLLLCCDGGEAEASALADRLAEEGYVVLLPDLLGGGATTAGYSGPQPVSWCKALRSDPAFKGQLGALGFGAGARAVLELLADGTIACAVLYDPEPSELIDGATGNDNLLIHRSGTAEAEPPPHTAEGRIPPKLFYYPGTPRGFGMPGRFPEAKAAADMAYSRTVGLLRREIGPQFDLDALWEAHRACEFVTRDADATMETMVGEPYVNHVPTMTGGFGQKDLHRFYRDHFIPNNPPDMRNIPISRTVGSDRVVNEGILCFTHDRRIDWLLPGVEATGRYVEIALIGIITFRGDKLVHEHIYWDQASLLVQVGLLDPIGLPVVGIEAARKVMDPSLPSNALLKSWAGIPA